MPTLAYISSNPLIATVSNGIIRGVSKGECEIKISTTDGSNISKIVKVTVTKPVESVTPVSDTVQLHIGTNYALSCTVLPDDASDKTLKYESLNTNIVDIDANGVIYAKASGTCTIKITSNNNENANCLITCYVVGNLIWREIIFDGTHLNYDTGQSIYQNLLYINNSINQTKNEIFSFNNNIDFSDGYAISINRIAEILNSVEENISATEERIDWYDPYRTSETIEFVGDTIPNQEDVNRWIGFCNFTREIIEKNIQKPLLLTDSLLNPLIDKNGKIILLGDGYFGE